MIRKFAALSLAKHIYAAIRWIPNERNSADVPSRYFDDLHRVEKHFSKKAPCEENKQSQGEDSKQHKSRIVN